MPTRRQMLERSAGLATMLAGLGLLPAAAQAAWPAAAFEAKGLAEALKALGHSAPVESRDVVLGVTEIAENGAAVPVSCGSTLPGVKRLLLLVEKNPNLLCALFEPSEALEPVISTRVKLAETSLVYAVAVMADNKVLYARKEVKVVQGGCGV